MDRKTMQIQMNIIAENVLKTIKIRSQNPTGCNAYCVRTGYMKPVHISETTAQDAEK